MERRTRRQARIRLGKDPLGLNLESIAEPLQRWYLIGRGNPYFDDEVKEARERLGVPSYGFAEHADYDAWLAESGRRHGHVERESVVVGTIYMKSHELLQRALGTQLGKDLHGSFSDQVGLGGCFRKVVLLFNNQAFDAMLRKQRSKRHTNRTSAHNQYVSAFRYVIQFAHSITGIIGK